VGNVSEFSVSELWQRLGDVVRKPHREHRWADIPEICQGCRDWQTAGAEYEQKDGISGARPFWYNPETTDFKIAPTMMHFVKPENLDV
jgi:hypothetical protein